MIRKVGKKFAICYDANGEKFQGGFPSEGAAFDAFWAMSPFNRMVVTGITPSAKTDREFMMDTANGKQFEGKEIIGDRYKKVAEKHGGSVNGKKYLRQLANFPGDPKAWVSGRSDVIKVLEERGDGCDGAVKTKLKELAPYKKTALAPDILARNVKEQVAREGGRVSAKRREEIHGEVLSKRVYRKLQT